MKTFLLLFSIFIFLYITCVMYLVLKIFGKVFDDRLMIGKIQFKDLTTDTNSKDKDSHYKHIQGFNNITVHLSNEISTEKINILLQLVNATSNIKLQRSFHMFLMSLISNTNSRLRIYITGQPDDWILAKSMIKSVYGKLNKTIISSHIFMDINSIARQLSRIILNMQDLFSSHDDSYYRKSLFYIPLALHRIDSLQHVSQLVMFDIDMQLKTDVKDLYNIFQLMGPTHLYGLAREQQPIYRHLTSEFRKRHKFSVVGNPPPFGLTGFNSGTKLIRLTSLRHNKLYNSYLDDPLKLRRLADKFHFHGHLGDQDFFTLLSFLHKDLFYELPCQWNRQLCEWWRKIYPGIFDQYFNCTPPYFALHGNCATKISKYS